MFRAPANRRRKRSAHRRAARFQQLEKRNLLAAAPLGATELDTGEFLLGRVAVTPIFFESDGSIDAQSQNWTPTEIDEMLAKISEGVNWWAETLDGFDSVHSLEFVIDDTYAKNPVETPYELIDRNSEGFELALSGFMDSLDYPGSSALQNAVLAFNHDQREKLATDWSFTIVVVDSSDDINPSTGQHDGFFAPGGYFSGAFAFSGGLFMVTLSTRPASTITHEMGHIFWARDEYPGAGSWTDRRGYYNTQNLNASDNPTGGFVQEDSIMRGGYPLSVAYENHTSPASTLAMVGWQDSDNDGIFDVADVPLNLQGVGYFDASTSTYHFDGTANAVALANQNSEGPQSDITLNRVSELQYRLDGGAWIVASTPDQQVVDFDLQIVIDQAFSTIDWRAIDVNTTVTSNIVEGTIKSPAISAASITGYVFLDEDDNSIRAGSEPLMSNVSATLRNADGTPLFSGEVHANELPDGYIASGNVTGVTLTNQGFSYQRQLGVFESPIASNQKFFQSFDAQVIVWSEQWNANNVFIAKFDQDVGEVNLQIWGANAGSVSYGRIEAYDRNGQLIKRVTSDAVSYGKSTELTIQDAGGEIAEIRAFGHANSSIAISDLSFGFDDQITTNGSGALQFSHLPDGDYVLELAATKLIYAFDDPAPAIQVTNGASDDVVVIASRVTSPRHNANMPGDVNRDQIVTAQDALVIINDLNINRPRTLGASETAGPSIDVNNDGDVTALDALLVINALSSNGNADGTDSGGTDSDGESELGEGEAKTSELAAEQDSGAQQNSQAEQGFEPSIASRDRALAQWPSHVRAAADAPPLEFSPDRVAGDALERSGVKKLNTPPMMVPSVEPSKILPMSEEISEKFPQNLVVNEKSLSTMGSESMELGSLTGTDPPLSTPAI
ncbi:dockerin type I domain-containing protein [Novipirellula caenicola]|uniref:Dockerin type I repeat protein n=1 Tax=Novipirellula caenicola TaxID=1536901 RepID=A0ABP9VMJ0_9BACT